MFEIILRNSAKCKKCGDEIRSYHRHDFRSCKCGLIAVDGGEEYLRRVGEFGAMEDTSVVRPYTLEEINKLIDSYEGKDWAVSIKNAAIKWKEKTYGVE